ncbi:GDSL-type esterase/lipase family protein [Jatrophihabitans endophyticus]|uniref:SGNH/GDSL hydrolase family protein n=1 Tax=Jatrophihabitans endophyticus TaxID=1206085 RepID=UPI0019E797DF|nr:GDSL-type esterase/lipase family protein [Jatrophihabitans endophyticus]MBE7186921.1 SGNH/GDSL hydrolase family protein [Jatrophihabitans endophyticus]
MTVIRTTRALIAGAAIAVAGTALAVAAPATAAPQHAAASTPVTKGSYYLALGDSVPFGYREATSTPTPNYQDASTFQGYPEIVGQDLGLKVANAACPGETSSSFVHVTAQSNGCEANSAGVAQAGYRTNYPLHESYKASQLVYAKHFLTTHKNTKLVTLMVGANDGFICQASTTDQCTSLSEIGAVVQKIEKNVAQIIKAVRGTGYSGQIVIVNYYSTDYTNTTNGGAQQAGATAINNGLDQGAWPSGSGNPNDVTIASTYKAFQSAAAQTSGDDCTAGLLTILTGDTTPCGVHPSVAGQNIIANSVVQAIKK